LTPAGAGLLKLRGSGLGLLKSKFNAENFVCRLFDLSLAVLAQFTLKMCAAAGNYPPKFTKTRNFGGSRSFKVIDVDETKKPMTSACYDEQHVCT